MKELSPEELEKTMLKSVQHDTQPNDAFETGYRAAEKRLLPVMEKCATDNQTLVDECNERGKRLVSMEPMLKKLIGIVAAPLLEDLELEGHRDGQIDIGEKAYSYEEMARLIREADPVGLKFMNEWIIANDYLKNRTR